MRRKLWNKRDKIKYKKECGILTPDGEQTLFIYLRCNMQWENEDNNKSSILAVKLVS